MRTTRFYLLLGLALLVVLAVTGCLGERSGEPKSLFTASMLEEVIPFTASFDGSLSYDPNGRSSPTSGTSETEPQGTEFR